MSKSANLLPLTKVSDHEFEFQCVKEKVTRYAALTRSYVGWSLLFHFGMGRFGLVFKTISLPREMTLKSFYRPNLGESGL